MKPAKHHLKQRDTHKDQLPSYLGVDKTISNPEFREIARNLISESGLNIDGPSASASRLHIADIDDEVSPPCVMTNAAATGDSGLGLVKLDLMAAFDAKRCTKHKTDYGEACKGNKEKAKCPHKQAIPKKCGPSSPTNDIDEMLLRQIRDIHLDTRKSTRIIRDSRARLLEIQKKVNITEADVKEIGERNELLLREMERFDKMTKSMQRLVAAGSEGPKRKEDLSKYMDYFPGSIYEPTLHHEMKMGHPTVLLAGARPTLGPSLTVCEPTRSKSEIDLTRKLSESYDMQEKLAADNADLEVKRYILYKELMTKDQNLETCRAQIKRLQGELKLMNKENSLLNERLSKNNPEGDATTVNTKCTDTDVTEQNNEDTKQSEELLNRLETYKSSTKVLEKQLGSLEQEVHFIKSEMDKAKSNNGCKGGSASGGNTCFEQPPGGPLVPPMTRACGVCPPCPAPCNPNAPPKISLEKLGIQSRDIKHQSENMTSQVALAHHRTPAEREVAKLTLQLRQTEESFKTKVTECAMLRTELLKKKEELEKERCQHREATNKLRELEMKFEGLNTHTKMLLGSKEHALEQEVNVRTLKQCYREAREEIDEIRILMKEQNDQLQDYRVKYLQAQQLVEEQRRQMDLMDMDNTRISEQINLEIQKVKIKFQEKLQELAPIPDLLKATQVRLKDAQQSQALAEHNAEQLARELNCAREKVHMLLHNIVKTPEKGSDKENSDKQIQLLQQRITQLTENNMALKSEIDRLKSNVIRMEEAVLANEKRLQEKMHECAQLGGELDRIRDEAARALQRANERTDTIRKCMQTTVAELERQLAACRAQVSNAEKDREELQCRMQCQIKRLNDNFAQAQLRVLGLQTQVATLRRTVSSTGEGDADENQECTCVNFFDNP